MKRIILIFHFHFIYNTLAHNKTTKINTHSQTILYSDGIIITLLITLKQIKIKIYFRILFTKFIVTVNHHFFIRNVNLEIKKLKI